MLIAPAGASRRARRGRVGALALILSGLVLVAALRRAAGPDETPNPLRIVAPSADEILTSHEGVFAVRIDGEPGGDLTLSLDGRDVTDRFPAGSPRNERGGGGELRVAWLPLGDEPAAGTRRFAATLRRGGREWRAGVSVRQQPAALIVRHDVRERGREGERAVPARLTFIGLDATPDPNFAAASMAEVDPVGRETVRPFVETDGRPGWIGLPAGRYAVIASRGLRHSVSIARLEGSGVQSRRFVLEPIGVERGDWACDFHVHGLASPDSFLPPAPRLRAYAAAAADALVASDHNVVSEYRPFLDATSASVLPIAGVETGLQRPEDGRPHSIGHWTAWPLAAEGEGLVRGRVPALTDAEPHALYARLFPLLDPQVARALGVGATGPAARPVIQLNHPRGLPLRKAGGLHRDKSWFAEVAIGGEIGRRQAPPDGRDAGSAVLIAALRRSDPETGVSNADFDAIELYNRASLALYLESRADYFALLRAGFVKTATANSDSHSIADEPAGAPINLVAAGIQPPGASASAAERAAAIAALMRAVRAGHVSGGTGPRVALDVMTKDGGAVASAGDLLRAPGGLVQAEATITAPAWVPVHEVRWFVNGASMGSEPVANPTPRGMVPPAGHITRLRRWTVRREFRLAGDSFIYVEAGERLPAAPGDLPPAEGVYGRVVPRQWSLSFANPVRLEVDGQPGWRPDSSPVP